MKYFGLLTIATFLMTFSVQAQDTEPRLDTIVSLGGRKLIVNVVKVNQYFAQYRDNETGELKDLSLKKIQKIVYENGKIEEYNEPIFQMLDENSWETVILTEEAADVEGLYDLGVIEAESAPTARSKKAAKRNCALKLQKMAAARKGAMILIIHKETTGGYGELPGYAMKGRVYGYEPPEEKRGSSKDEENGTKKESRSTELAF